MKGGFGDSQKYSNTTAHEVHLRCEQMNMLEVSALVAEDPNLQKTIYFCGVLEHTTVIDMLK